MNTLMRPYHVHTASHKRPRLMQRYTAPCRSCEYIAWTSSDEVGSPLVYRVMPTPDVRKFTLSKAYADDMGYYQPVCVLVVDDTDWDVVYLAALEKLGEGNSADAHRVRTARDLENLEREHLAQVEAVNRRIARDNWIATGLGCLALAMFAVVMYFYG